MEDILNKKLAYLKKELSSNQEKNHMLNRLNAYDWISSCFKIDGKNFNIEKIHEMEEGTLFDGAKLSDFTDLKRYQDLVKFSYNNIDMGNSFDRNIMKKMNTEISTSIISYRTSNAPILERRYTPTHSNNILEEIKKMEYNVYHNWKDGTVLEKSSYIFGSLIKISPFESENLQIAISSAFYFLLYNGYPIPSSQYLNKENLINETLLFINKNSLSGIYNIFLNNIDKKVEALIKA